MMKFYVLLLAVLLSYFTQAQVVGRFDGHGDLQLKVRILE